MLDVVGTTFVGEISMVVTGATTVFVCDGSGTVFVTTGTVSVDEAGGVEVVSIGVVS